MKRLGRGSPFQTERYLGNTPNLSPGQMMIESRVNSAAAGPVSILDRFRSAGAASDFLGIFRWLGRSTTGVSRIFSEIASQIVTATNAAEDGKIIFRAMKAGALTDVGYMAQGLVLGAPTGGDQGSGSINATAVKINGVDAVTTPVTPLPRRQTVLSGPVDSNGISSFGGSLGSSTVTATGTLIVTASNGFNSAGQVDRIGSITNPSWTGLTNVGSIHYLYLDIASNGVCTPGFTILAPVYQLGGTYSITNNQFTFNVTEMVGKVGNGASAAQTYRVFVGEALVGAGPAVTSISWYQQLAKYIGTYTATLPNVSVTAVGSHALGTKFVLTRPIMLAKCTTIDAGYAVGDIIMDPMMNVTTGAAIVNPIFIDGLTFQWGTGNTGWMANPRAGGNLVALTRANWSWTFIVDRGW